MPFSSQIFSDLFCMILPYLSLSDVFALRQACRHFMAMTRQRSVWSLLIRISVIERNLPLPGLAGRSINSLHAQELERLTCVAARLHKRWTSPYPNAIRKTTLRPTQPPSYRPHSLHFLPGRGHRWLLSLIDTNPSATRIQCWDLLANPPRCVAGCHIVKPMSFVLNTDPRCRWVFAFQDPHIELVEIDFRSTDPEKGFISVPVVPLVRQRLFLFSGSTVVTGDDETHLIVWDTDKVDYKVRLGTPDLANDKFEAGIIRHDFLILARSTEMQIYSLSSFRARESGFGLIYPIARYRWQWRVHSLLMTERVVCAEHNSSVLPPITILLRIRTVFPWPANGLHHLGLVPNALYTPSDPVDRHNLPYLFPPTVLQAVASPVQRLSVYPMALGRHGTALWVDSHTQGRYGAGEVGQRLAAVQLRPVATDGLDANDEASYALTAGATTVFGMRGDDSWARLALDEEEGRIAIASTRGEIFLLHYV